MPLRDGRLMWDAVAPRGWSIRVKSVMLALGYLLVLSAVYGAFTVHVVQREVAEAHERLRQTARLVAAEIDGALDAGVQRLETVSRLPGLAYGLQSIQAAPRNGYIPPWTTLHYLFFKSTLFEGGVFLLDHDGVVLWTEPPGLPWLHANLRASPGIAEVFATPTRAVSGLLAPDALASGPHVVVAVPITNGVGELQGVLGGVVDLAAPHVFGDVLASIATTNGRYVRIVDQHDAVLLATDPEHPVAADTGEARDDDPLRAMVRLETAPWRVVAGQPPALGLQGVWRSQRMLLVAGAALLLVLVATAMPVINGFVRGIRRLGDAAQTVARGDLSQPVEVGTGRDEIASLARTFDQMRRELGASRDALEHRLAEREQLIRQLVESNEQLVRAQARLIEAERFAAIGELSAAVAHGIRNPVAGIKMAAQLASVELPHDHPLRRNVDDIVGEADKLEARITTLLNFAKPFEPQPRPCRVERIVEAAASSLRHQAEGRGLTLVLDVRPGLPVVAVDEAQIEQVLLDLLANAIDATPSGGTVTIAAEPADDDRGIRISVRDTGSGITAANMRRVFTLFFTTKPNGSGFGLAVAKKIVERHGGTITVASEVGCGTGFTIVLPVTPEDFPAPRP